MGFRGQRTEDGGQVLVRAPRGPLIERGKAARKPQFSASGFSLFELVVVVALIAILAGALMSSVQRYQALAEKTAMEEVAGAVQSALTMQYGELVTRGKPADLEALARDNPMNWMQKRPHNYAGEFYDATPQSAESGNWLFDLKSRELVYLVRHANSFTPGKDGKPWIRFRVTIQREQSRLPSRQNAPAELTGLVFGPDEPYQWY